MRARIAKMRNVQPGPLVFCAITCDGLALDDSVIGDAVIFREIVRRRQTMAAAYNYDLVIRLWARLTPGRRPMLVP